MDKINVRQGKRYEFATHVNEMLLPRERAEAIEAFRVVIEPGKYTHPHAHQDTEQLYYVLTGSGRVVFGSDGRDQELTLEPEDVVHLPRGVRHQVFCSSEEPLVYLCVDGFPLGRPADEPTWDDHYAAVIRMQKAQTQW